MFDVARRSGCDIAPDLAADRIGGTPPHQDRIFLCKIVVAKALQTRQ
jgi:hypothetical protein